MKECKKILIRCSIAVALLFLCYLVFMTLNSNAKNNKGDLQRECKYVVYFSRYNKKGSNRKSLAYYYDEKFELIHIEDFKPKDKVPNQIMLNDKIYSYGYGGIYETDIISKETTAVNTEAAINIVKNDNYGNIYIYQNFGFEKGDSGKYNSKILKNNVEYLQLDYPVVDFCIYNNILYVTTYNDISMKDGKIGIYENQKLIKEYDVDLSNGEGCWAICNENIFFLKTNSALDVDKAELKEIHFEGLNEKLAMPMVTNSADFSKLYINSMEVKYYEDRLIFTDTRINDFTNYNPLKDRVLDCYFDKKEQTLKINEAIVKIDNNKKYNYVFLSAFEI